MCQLRAPLTICFLIIAIILFPAHGASQTPVDPGQLPSRTIFYLSWHGTPTGEARKSNSLYALWDDPEFSSARDSLAESFLDGATNQTSRPSLSRQELTSYFTLLDNPFLIGYEQRPAQRATPKSSNAKADPPPAWNGMFFIYDRSGKEELLSKAVMQMRGAEKDIPKLSPTTVAGISALKVERKSGITYWAEFGKYAVSANELQVFEDILNVVNGKPGSGSLSQSNAFQEAKPLLSGGVMEFFLRIPSIAEIAQNAPNGPGAQTTPFLNALKLDSVHSLAGKVALEGTRTRLSAAILGDTTQGGLFDIWADGSTNPLSLGYLASGTISYGDTELNLTGIYNLVKRAFAQAGGNSAQSVSLLDSIAQARLGMPLADALALTTGQIAYLQTSPTLDDNQKIILLGIRNKTDAMKLLRTIMGDRITSERNEGNTTFLKISLKGGQGSAGVAQWNFYHLAMTPTLLLGSSKIETLHKYADQLSTNPEGTLPKNIQAARLQYPEKLNGFSYFDFQKVDWPALRAKWLADARRSAQAAKTTDASKVGTKFGDWLNQLNPEVFPRHLHTMVGASWKDAKGVHFEESLD